MACPFFMPVEKLQNGAWLHAGRLPLGCGWTGHCTAPGNENAVPSADQLRDYCNLGYAEGCCHLPSDRAWDSVRFGARTTSQEENNSAPSQIQVRYICERGHRPIDHGILKFDAATFLCEQKHSDHRVQRLAECFLVSYVEKRKKPQVNPAVLAI